MLQPSGVVLRHEAVAVRAKAEGREPGEQLVIETLVVLAERFRPELFEKFCWSLAMRGFSLSSLPCGRAKANRQPFSHQAMGRL